MLAPLGAGGSTVKNLPVNAGNMQETRVHPLDREDPLKKGTAWRKEFLPGEVCGQRSLAGYSPWDHKESARTESARLVAGPGVILQEPSRFRISTHFP